MSSLRGTLLSSALLAALGVWPASSAAQGKDTAYLPLMLDGHPVRWLSADRKAPVVLSFAIADREIDQPGAANCRRLGPPTRLIERSSLPPNAFRHALEDALTRWRDVADVTFVEASPGAKADIVVGEQLDPVGYAFTNLELGVKEEGQGAIRAIRRASICLNPERVWKLGYDGNLAIYDLAHTLTHELGHAIGLDHPGSRGHLMSFKYTEDQVGLTEGDRLGAIAIYGPSRLYSTLATAEPITDRAGEPIITSTIGRSLSPAAPQ